MSDEDPSITPAERRRLRAERAQHARERRIWWSLAAAGVVVLTIFGLLFWPVMAARLDAVKQVDEAQAHLAQADSPIAQIDKVVAVQLSPEGASAVPSIETQMLIARRELNAAEGLVADAMPHLTEDEQKRAELLLTAVKARRTMVDRATTILRASVKAVKAKTIADQAWQLTLLALSDETSATQKYQSHKASSTARALAAVVTIRERLGEARALYSQATTAFPEAGFQRYVVYTDMRRKLVDQLELATRLWLAHDLAGAASAFAQYQASAAKVEKVRAALPYAPGTATGIAFQKLAGRAADAYAKAKQLAAQTDKALATP